METAAREFQIMVKTVGAICNLDCHYCYYLKKEDLYPKGTNFCLSDETLERYIIKHIKATPKENSTATIIMNIVPGLDALIAPGHSVPTM